MMFIISSLYQYSKEAVDLAHWLNDMFSCFWVKTVLQWLLYLHNAREWRENLNDTMGVNGMFQRNCTGRRQEVNFIINYDN